MALVNSPPTSPLAVKPGRTYPGGYEDDSVEQYAHEDGQAVVNVPSVWGENTHPHAIDALNAAHDADARLIAHRYRGEVQDTTAILAETVPQAHSALQRALDALDVKHRAQIAMTLLRHEIEAQGLKVPGVRALWWLIAGLAALFFGETPLISTSFQEFGLSDHPLIPFVQFTDELHMAAYGSVTALLVLAHVAGYKLRLLVHDSRRRRLAATDEAKAQLPPASRFHMGIMAVCLLVAIPILAGLSAIRAAYLSTKGTDAQTLPFLAIQMGIFGAALFLSFMHAHPYGRAWSDRTRDLVNAEKAWTTAETTFNALLGSVNTNVELLSTLLTQAGHHVGASEADVRRQIALYARRVILSQPEPTTEQLLPKNLAEPTTRVDTDMAKFLIGIEQRSTFEKLNTKVLSRRQSEIRTELRTLEKALSGLDIGDEGDAAAELADLDDLEAETW